MKIINDLNNNSDLLSVSKKEDEDTSLLGSLFSIDFNNSEVKLNDISDDIEFVLQKEDLEIISFLSDNFPNLNISNLDLADFNKVKNKIETDQNIKTEVKDKLVSLLETAKDYNKNLFIQLPEYNKYKVLKEKNNANNPGNPKIKNKSLQISSPFFNGADKSIDQSGDKSLKLNAINGNNSGIIKSENRSDNQTATNFSNKKIKFVKKIKRNDHPNKLYQSLNSNSLQLNEKIGSKLSNNQNLNYINNLTNDDLNKNKINEIKANEKVLNIQNELASASKGNQFSQQNNTSFSNGGFNSVLERFLETLDLTQKGWTTKLVSRIENALENGGEEIEFNLKPKNLGRLKVSISLKNGTGNVKIVTENNFVTNALTQNENHLQKLFNDQGINLEFSAHDDTKYFGSKHSFNKNSNNNDQNNFQKSENEKDKQNAILGLDNNVSSRHIVNVIA